MVSMSEELLYNQLYERTKDFGRSQFIKELMRLEREVKKSKEQLQRKDSVIEEAIKYMELISLDKTDKYIAIKDYEEYEILLDILNKYKNEDKEDV